MLIRVHSNRISLSLVFMLLTILVTLTVSSCSSEIVEVPVDKIVEKEVPVEVIKEVEVIREVAVGQQIIKEAVKGAPQLPDVYTDSNGGITVSGSATISVEPDLAILDMGVEAFGKTVSFARSDAAIAMDAIVSSLKSEGVLEKDIQTQRLNISPKYEWKDIFVGSQVTNKQFLTGYSVTNSVRVKIRNLDRVGRIVDSASESGGDFVRVNGISFDSRKVKKGDIFFAIKGNQTSGIKFINEAISKGASVIISSKKVKYKNGQAPIIVVKNVRSSLSEACSNFYKKKPTNIIAVTGTNGKSSVVDFFYQILNFNKASVASIGTLGIFSKNYNKKINLTSMDPLSLHKNLEILAKNKIKNEIGRAHV